MEMAGKKGTSEKKISQGPDLSKEALCLDINKIYQTLPNAFLQQASKISNFWKYIHEQNEKSKL